MPSFFWGGCCKAFKSSQNPVLEVTVHFSDILEGTYMGSLGSEVSRSKYFETLTSLESTYYVLYVRQYISCCVAKKATKVYLWVPTL